MWKKIYNNIKYWAQIFLLPIYCFSFLVPRNKKIWLFGSTFGRRFADNPKYLYLYINQKEKEKIRAIWISKNKQIVNRLKEYNLEVYYYYSIKAFFYCMIAGVYIFDNYSKDISFWFSGRSLKVNLWHGIPLKKIQADNKFDKIRHPDNNWKKFYYALRRMSDEKPWHYILTTSDFLVPIFSSAFNTSHVLTSGYPRTDILVSNRIQNIKMKSEEEDYQQLVRKKYKKFILYMPTFRNSENKFFDIVILQQLKEFMEKEQYLFCIKLHPKSKLKKEFESLVSANIFILDADHDPYIFLGMADLLITDYSSIYFDYLWLDRPILFFDYDKRDYLEHSREFYFNYEEFTPGVKVETMEQLFQAIREIDKIEIEKQMKLRRIILRDKVFDKSAAFASQRLFQEVEHLVNFK